MAKSGPRTAALETPLCTPYNNKRRPTPDLFSILTSFCPLDPSPFSQYIFYLLRPPLTKSPSSLRKGYIT